MEGSIGAQIASVFTGAFTGITSGLSSGLVEAFDTVIVNPEGGLTNLAIWGIVFGGIAFGTWLVKKLMHKVG